MSDNGKAWLLVIGLVGLLYLSAGQQQGCSIAANTSPIPELGTRILITYNETTRGSLPKGQKEIIDSTDLRNWLDQNCTKDGAGNPAWRIWPDDRDKADDVALGKMLTLAKGKNEWLIVADGKKGVNQALPPDLASLNAILSAYGNGK